MQISAILTFPQQLLAGRLPSVASLQRVFVYREGKGLHSPAERRRGCAIGRILTSRSLPLNVHRKMWITFAGVPVAIIRVLSARSEL